MSNAGNLPSMIACAISVVLSIGCRTPPEHDPELAASLQNISYDTSIRPASASLTPSEEHVPASTSADATAPESKSFHETIGDGMKATAGLLLYGTAKIAWLMLGLDDEDDGYDLSPRGRADRDLKNWTEARSRWRSEKR